jgi:dTDP-4-dehydrorhamnose reductase
VAEDVFISPTYLPDLVNASLDLLIDREKGIWHLTNKGETTWADLAFRVADKKQLDDGLINRKPMEMMNWRAPRPRFSVLKSEKGILLPSLDNALNRFFEEIIKNPVDSLILKDL